MHGKQNKLREIADELYNASNMHADQARRIDSMLQMDASMGPAMILELGGMEDDDRAMMDMDEGMDMDMDMDSPEEMLDMGKDLLCRANKIYEQLPPEMRRKMDKHIKKKEEQRMGYNKKIDVKEF